MRSNVVFRKCWGNYLSELEIPLASIGFQYEEGIYKANSLLPFYYKYDYNVFTDFEIETLSGQILVPREKLNYETLIRVYLPIYSKKRAIIKFLSHGWETNSCSTEDLSPLPRVQCLGMVLIKSLIATASYRTRAFSYSSSQSAQRDLSVEDILTEALETEMAEQYKDTSLFYDVYEYVRGILYDSTINLLQALSLGELRWRVIETEFNHDESVVLALNDYRITDWMLTHERMDW